MSSFRTIQGVFDELSVRRRREAPASSPQRWLWSRVHAMLGYSIHPPFIGQVDGMHPLRLVDPAYREHKTEDHIIADRVLTAPRVGDATSLA